MSEDAVVPDPVLAPRRPGGVTFVLVLTWIVAIGDLIAGIVLFLMSFNRTMVTEGAVDVLMLRYYAMGLVIVGLVTALVAMGLGGGSQFARGLTILVMAVRVATALWAVIVIRDVTLWSALFDAVFAVLIIGLLTNRSASDYFRRRG